MSDDKSPYLKLIQGAAAGLIATVPMTLFMRSAWKRLPAQEQYALPPREITRNVIRPHRLFRISPEKQTVLTLLLHFLFGAAAGSAYGMVEEKIPLRESVKGPLAGLAVWTGSYLGWIPALGILPPATAHPWRRNAMMIVAHLIWGVVLGVLAGVTNSKKTISGFSKRRVRWRHKCNQRFIDGLTLVRWNEACLWQQAWLGSIMF